MPIATVFCKVDIYIYIYIYNKRDKTNLNIYFMLLIYLFFTPTNFDANSSLRKKIVEKKYQNHPQNIAVLRFSATTHNPNKILCFKTEKN